MQVICHVGKRLEVTVTFDSLNGIIYLPIPSRYATSSFKLVTLERNMVNIIEAKNSNP